MEPDWVQLLITLPAVFTIIWAVYTFTQERQAKQEEERKQLSALYVNPFLLACEELQSRLYNMLCDAEQGISWNDLFGGSSLAEETLYLIAQYFGWERRLFRYGPYTQDRKVFQRTEAIRATFASNRLGVPIDTDPGRIPFCFYRYQQKALAQFTIQRIEGQSGHDAETISYLDFKRGQRGIERSLPSVEATLKALQSAGFPGDLKGPIRGRLAEVQHHLVMLLTYLEDKEGFSLFAGKRRTVGRQLAWKEWAQEKAWHAFLGDEYGTVAKDPETDPRTVGETHRPQVVVFDVNETLLDLSALDPHFERAFGDTSARQQWFAQVLQSALVVTIDGSYVNFGAIGEAALEMMAVRSGISLSASDRDAILGGMLNLPPHPEVPECLARLRAAGLRLATLTNSTAEVAEAQLTSAGLIEYFDRVLSVDPVRHFKPAIETYHMAARELDVAASDLLLVAAHDWDVAGALRAGWAAAFVARPGMVLGPLSQHPDIVGRDLYEVVDQLLEE